MAAGNTVDERKKTASQPKSSRTLSDLWTQNQERVLLPCDPHWNSSNLLVARALSNTTDEAIVTLQKLAYRCTKLVLPPLLRCLLSRHSLLIKIDFLLKRFVWTKTTALVNLRKQFNWLTSTECQLLKLNIHKNDFSKVEQATSLKTFQDLLAQKFSVD